LAGRMAGRRHLRVTRSLMSSCSSANAQSLLAVRAAGSGGEGQGLACPVEVKVRRGRVVYRGGVIRAEAEAARGRKRGLRRSWGRDDTMGAACGEGVGSTTGGGKM
jgi:hypothetical protein